MEGIVERKGFREWMYGEVGVLEVPCGLEWFAV